MSETNETAFLFTCVLDVSVLVARVDAFFPSLFFDPEELQWAHRNQTANNQNSMKYSMILISFFLLACVFFRSLCLFQFSDILHVKSAHKKRSFHPNDILLFFSRLVIAFNSNEIFPSGSSVRVVNCSIEIKGCRLLDNCSLLDGSWQWVTGGEREREREACKSL